MIYLVLSSLCLALFYGVYRLALSRTTLHRFNRVMLLSILAISFILPAVRIDSIGVRPLFHENDTKGDRPQLLTLWTDETDTEEDRFQLQAEEATFSVENDAKGDSPQLHTRVALGVRIMEAFMQMDIVRVITYFYLMGVMFFMIRLLIGIIRVETLCRLGGSRLCDGSKLVILEGEFQPSSWLNTILISRNDYETDSTAIIEHEQAHIRCHHSVDVLLAQIVCALHWFNPAAWMLKRSLTEVHEYEADATVLSCGYNERQYQVSLVQAALRRQVGLVTSNFADCSTKKRINMMKRSQSSPFACLRALLLLPVVAVIITFASACKQNANNNSQTGVNESDSWQTVSEAVKSEPYDTIAFLKKFGYGLNQEDIKIKQLNHFVTIEADGSIWFNIAGQNNYERAYLSSLDRDFELAKSKNNVEVTNPEKVYVMYNKENHLGRCAEVIRQLQKNYSDENIVFVRELSLKTVPPPPGLTIDTEKDDYLIVMINANNEIRMEGKWSPGEGIKASFNSHENISPLEISQLDDLIRTAIPEINEKNPGERLIVDGLKASLQWDRTSSHRVVNEVEKILRRYVDPAYIIRQRPEVIVNSK